MDTGINISSTVYAIVAIRIGKYHRQWQIDKAKTTVAEIIQSIYEHVIKHGQHLFVPVRKLAEITGKSVSTIQKWMPSIRKHLFTVERPAFWREDLGLTNLAPKLVCRPDFWRWCQSRFFGHSKATRISNSEEERNASHSQNKQMENGREENKPKKREYKRISEEDRLAFSIELYSLTEKVRGTVDYQANVMDFSPAIQQLIWSRGGSPPQPNREMFPEKHCGCYPILKASTHDDNLGALYWYCPKCQVKSGIGRAPIKRKGKNTWASGITDAINVGLDKLNDWLNPVDKTIDANAARILAEDQARLEEFNRRYCRG